MDGQTDGWTQGNSKDRAYAWHQAVKIKASSCVSKLFERVLVEILGEALESDMLQYGFKKELQYKPCSV